LIAIAFLGLPLSCQREPEREPVLRPAFAEAHADAGVLAQPAPAAAPSKAGRIETEPAIKSLAAARCEHENKCGEIGAGRRYENRAACESAISSETYKDVEYVGCTAGIDREKFQICLNEAGDEGCDSALDTLQRIMACSARPLCGA